MFGDERFTQVQILINQKRYDVADKILKELMAQNPQEVSLLAVLAELRIQQDRFDEADEVLEMAIGQAPELSHLFYMKSRIFMLRGKFPEAEKMIRHAISIDPQDADYFAILAKIKIHTKEFETALGHADEALVLDAENLLALNIRSTALTKLKRTEESFATIEGALREDPNNVFTHSNYGWGLLEKGDHKKAMDHFREALRIDPNYEYAQAGMAQAIKATNPFYRMFLKYSFWMTNKTANSQWIFIFAFYFGVKFLRDIADNNEFIRPFVMPIVILLVIFAFSTWVIEPVSNLFLRFNKYGQFLLDKKEKMSSNFVAVSLLTSIIGLITYIITSNDTFLAVFVFGFGMMIPLSTMFRTTKFNGVLVLYTIAMALVGIGAIFISYQSGILMNSLSAVFLIGLFAYQWIANIVVLRS